jgi:uncharacterized protein
MPEIIDCHCHLTVRDFDNASTGKDTPLRRYLQRARLAGISRSVLFASFHPDYSVANRQVARIVARQRDRFFGFAFVHAQRDKGKIFSIVEEAVKNYGFCGIKVHRRDARITREICEAAREFSLPILYDIMGEVSVVQSLAREHPEVSFIIPHLGSFADDPKVHLALIQLLMYYPNIYADTSAVKLFDFLEKGVQKAGAHKFIFGSDNPWLHPGLEMEKILTLRLHPDEKERILGGNLLKLISRARSLSKSFLSPKPRSKNITETHYDFRAIHR